MTSSLSVARTAAAAPRVCSYPPYRYSQGEDIIEQAEHAGLYLDPWQQMVLQHAMGERDDGKWSAFEVALIVARQNGKGAILEARALAGLFLLGEELILHSAHEYRTAMEAHRRIVACIRRMARRVSDNLFDYDGVPIKVVNTNGEEGLERLDTGQRLQFIARSKNAGRGFTADCLIWDEAYALAEDQVDAQMPTLSARPNTQIWYTSSPPLDAVSGAQLFRVRRRGLDGDPQLAYFDYGAEGCLDDLKKIDLDDRALWAATNPAYPDRITEEAIQRERAGMSDAGFARERLSIWPPDLSQGFQVVPEADWLAAMDKDSRTVNPVAFAAAVSLDREWAAIAVAGKRADGLLHVEITSKVTPHGVDLDNRKGRPDWVVPRLVELAGRHKPCAVVMDEFGPTGALIAAAEEAGLEITRIKTGDVGRAYGMFYDAAIRGDKPAGTLRHRGQPELTAAVAGATKRSIGDATAWDRRNASVDITPLVAATNALWGYATRPAEQPVEPWAFSR